MPRTIVQTVRFRAPAATLFELYADSKKHSAATGGAAKITRKAGATFSAWDGYITGRNLAIVPKRLVVQSWRASDWSDDDPDSTFVLTFSDEPDGRGRVDMVHANVPDDQAEALAEGWRDHYWTPWRAYLRARSR